MLARKLIDDHAAAMAKTVCQMIDPEMNSFDLEYVVRVLVPDFVRILQNYEVEHYRLLYMPSPSKN